MSSVTMVQETVTLLLVLVVSTAVFLLVVMASLIQMKTVMMETTTTSMAAHQSVNTSAVTESWMMSANNAITEQQTAIPNQMHVVPIVVIHSVVMVLLMTVNNAITELQVRTHLNAD